MIEDLEGATSEPARRGHVIVLSAVTAALALALLVVLVVPPSGGSVVEAPAATPSTSDAPTMTIVSGGESFRLGSGRVAPDQFRSQPEPLVCRVPRPDMWGPTFVVDGVSYAVGERAGRALPPPALVAATSSGWLALQIYDGSGRQLLYTCVGSDALTPRIDLSTIPR